MKFKKFNLILLSSLIIITFLLGGTAYAQEEELPDPGITPDSPFYFLDNWGKKIGMAFAFGPEAKIRKALEYAEERLAEAQAMALKNRIRDEESAILGYGEFLDIVTEKMEEARNEGVSDNISEVVALATAKHLSILDGVKDKAPEEAKEAIAKAREASMNGQQNALRWLAREKLERAVKINLDAIENRLNRASEKADEDDVEEVAEALEDADRMSVFGEEISEIARGLGQDTTTVEQLVAKATSAHLEVLARVYEKVPEQARAAIQNAIAASMKNRAKAVEALKSKGALGEIPEESALPEKIRREVAVKEQVKVRESESDNATLEPERSEKQAEEKARARTPVKAADSENITRAGKDAAAPQGRGNSKP